MLVTMVHPWRGERDVHHKAAPKYERNGWLYKSEAEFFVAGAGTEDPPPEPEPDPTDPPKRRRSKTKAAEPTEPSETDSEGFSMSEHDERQ